MPATNRELTDAPTDEPLAGRHEQFTVSADAFERAVEAYERAVLDGYADPFEVFLVNKTEAAETRVVVEGERDSAPSSGVLMDRVLVAETNINSKSRATFTLDSDTEGDQ
jgi:hypothetical protein